MPVVLVARRPAVVDPVRRRPRRRHGPRLVDLGRRVDPDTLRRAAPRLVLRDARGELLHDDPRLLQLLAEITHHAVAPQARSESFHLRPPDDRERVVALATAARARLRRSEFL